jgi:hypothetical protein
VHLPVVQPAGQQGQLALAVFNRVECLCLVSALLYDTVPYPCPTCVHQCICAFVSDSPLMPQLLTSCLCWCTGVC